MIGSGSVATKACIMPFFSYFSCHIDVTMFEGAAFPKSLNEEIFNSWLEKGRSSNMGYKYLLVIWDEYESNYRAAYAEDREELGGSDRYPSGVGRESMVAAYDLYSESRIL
ncbi:MAG TPA: hypothetical protein VGD31_16945 [Sphingobacteriaceae bacterium]